MGNYRGLSPGVSNPLDVKLKYQLDYNKKLLNKTSSLSLTLSTLENYSGGSE